MKKLLLLPYTFVILNFAALVAFYYFVTGKELVWIKTTTTLPDNRNKGKEIAVIKDVMECEQQK